MIEGSGSGRPINISVWIRNTANLSLWWRISLSIICTVETGRATEAPCLCTGQLLYTLHCPKTLSIRKQILLYINWPVWLPTGLHIVQCVSDRLICNLHTLLHICSLYMYIYIVQYTVYLAPANLIDQQKIFFLDGLVPSVLRWFFSFCTFFSPMSPKTVKNVQFTSL